MGLFYLGLCHVIIFRTEAHSIHSLLELFNTMKNMSGTIEAVQHNCYSYNWILLNIKHKSEESEDNMVEATSNTVIVYSVFWCKHSKS